MSRTRPKPQWLQQAEPMAAAVTALLRPYGEVVVHDISTDRIVGIWGSLSGRSIGDDSLLGDLPGEIGNGDVIGPYEKVSLDGSHITSASAVLRDDKGEIRGLLCINVNRAPINGMINVLSSFLAPAVDRPEPLFEKDWREQIALAVDDFCARNGAVRSDLSKSQREALVKELDEAGLFATRNAAQHAATALGVSRATVYTTLRKVKQ